MKNRMTNAGKLKTIVLIFLITIACKKTNAQPNVGLFSRVIEPESVKEQREKEIQKQHKPWRFGTGMETYNTKDLHGTYYIAHLCAIKNRTTLRLGPVMQKRTGEIQGARLGVSIAVRSDDAVLYPDGEEPDHLKLKFFAFAQYVNNSKLSYKAARVETLTNLDRNTDFSNMRISTATGALGCELEYSFKYISVRTYAGLSVFHHFNYDTSLFHEQTCAGLVFGAGICLHK